MVRLKLVHRDTLSCEAILRRAQNGELIIVSQCGDVSEPAPLNRVYIFHSKDNGQTWSKGQSVFPEDGRAVYATEVTVLRDEITVYLTLHDGHFNRCENVALKSRDNGYTWEPPIRFPEGFGTGFTFVRGLLQLRNGTLLLPFQNYKISKSEDDRLANAGLPVWNSDAEFVRNGVFISTDGGFFWKEGGCNLYPLKDASGAKVWQWTEPTLAQLSDDSVIMLLRVRGGYLYQSRSYDGGLSWSVPEKTNIPNPGNKPKLIQDGKRIILLNTPSAGYGYQYRTPLVVWVSTDDMQTWKEYPVTDFAGWLSYPDGIVEGNTVRFAFELNRHDVYYAEAEIE